MYQSTWGPNRGQDGLSYLYFEWSWFFTCQKMFKDWISKLRWISQIVSPDGHQAQSWGRTNLTNRVIMAKSESTRITFLWIILGKHLTAKLVCFQIPCVWVNKFKFTNRRDLSNILLLGTSQNSSMHLKYQGVLNLFPMIRGLKNGQGLRGLGYLGSLWQPKHPYALF